MSECSVLATEQAPAHSWSLARTADLSGSPACRHHELAIRPDRLDGTRELPSVLSPPLAAAIPAGDRAERALLRRGSESPGAASARNPASTWRSPLHPTRTCRSTSGWTIILIGPSDAYAVAGGRVGASLTAEFRETGVQRTPADGTTIPVIPLRSAPGERSAWNRSLLTVLVWSVVELVLVTNPWQISSRIRIRALRAFGADIGEGVVFRPRTRVRFPWKLRVGDGAWIGEGVWIHNQAQVDIGNDVVISQETFLTTGSHAHRRDMALITKPIVVDDGAWVTSRCMVLGGSKIGRSALVQPMSLVNGAVAPNAVVGGNPASFKGPRFPGIE